MSGAVYRIDVEHDPNETAVPWRAHVIRISDGETLRTLYWNTDAGAVQRARDYIVGLTMQHEGFSVFVDEDGNDVHSVKT